MRTTEFEFDGIKFQDLDDFQVRCKSCKSIVHKTLIKAHCFSHNYASGNKKHVISNPVGVIEEPKEHVSNLCTINKTNLTPSINQIQDRNTEIIANQEAASLSLLANLHEEISLSTKRTQRTEEVSPEKLRKKRKTSDLLIDLLTVQRIRGCCLRLARTFSRCRYVIYLSCLRRWRKRKHPSN